MSKILGWIKKHIWQTVMIGFGLFFLPLILVHIAYRITAISPWFVSTWTSGELVTYIAGFEAFIGTVYLGSIAIKQNMRSIDINDRLLTIEETHSKFYRYPNYKVSNCLIEHTCLNDIPDLNTVIFFRSGLDRKDICSLENLNQPFYRLSFNLSNESSHSYSVSLKSLVLTWLPDFDLNTVYDTLALASTNEFFTIAANQELQLGFIIYENDLPETASFLVEMEILVMNILGEKFVLSLEFLSYISNETKYFKLESEKIINLS